jgi:hypothetical protein
VWRWARDADDAITRVVLNDGESITGVEQQHR